MAATHDGWTVKGGVTVAAARAVLHHPHVNEHLGKEPLSSHAATGNPARTDEFVDFTLFNPQVRRHLSGGHKF